MSNAKEIAAYLISQFQEAGDPLDNLKLQKLLYYVQGWHLALLDKPAFGERLEAWVHGPVQPATYGEYKHYRWNPITDEVQRPKLDGELSELIKEVLDAYGGETGYELELRTHHEPPWLEARGGIPDDQESNAVISQASMKEYFKSLAGGG
ncbi:MAG: DUF4065 domain-containing protein [Candidatus Hydrogenedentes bacterium]|nr:DUF4065 domain-containing protein [Candidatus Hydrogenedentota bacterium]